MEQDPLASPGFSGEWQMPAKPGIHSYNLERRARPGGHPVETHKKNRGLAWIRGLFLLLGLAGIGFYGYTIAEQTIYQSYANWAFDEQIAGNTVTFWDYLRQLAGLSQTMPREQPVVPSKIAPEEHRPTPGELLGKVMIARLNMSAVVLEGVDDATLRRSAGHVPSTALPGDVGNFSIAAHRDTLFRPLKDIRVGDEVQFDTPQKNLVFRVVSTRIVKPTDVSVMAPQGDSRLLTMITCYPFYYLGSAPKRFIVTAQLEPQTGAVAAPQVPATPEPAAPARSGGHKSGTKALVSKRIAAANHISQGVSQGGTKGLTKGGFPQEETATADAAAGAQLDTPQPPKKRRGVWSTLVHAYQWVSDRLD
jgi:sortase A